jgi:hypothetical protein
MNKKTDLAFNITMVDFSFLIICVILGTLTGIKLFLIFEFIFLFFQLFWVSRYFQLRRKVR